MSLDDVPTYPGQYNPDEAQNNPGGGESRTLGDDQIRRMKASEKHTWPNVNGPVNASEAEINTLVGVSQADPIITLPVGTNQMFFQNEAPPDWVIVGSVNEHVIRLTSGTGLGGIEGGTLGGTNDFVDQFAAHAEGAALGVADHVLTVSEMPGHDHGGATGSHTHGIYRPVSGGSANFVSYAPDAGSAARSPQYDSPPAENVLTGDTATISPEGGDAGHGHTLDLAVRWASAIVATFSP